MDDVPVIFSLEGMGRIEYSTLSIGQVLLVKICFTFKNFIFIGSKM